MDNLREQKMEVATTVRTAAWRIAGEARTIGVEVPSSVRMVLKASDVDFIVAQHRRPTSEAVVTREIEAMEQDLDELARQKLGAIALLSDIRLAQANQAYTDQSSFGAAG